MQQTHSHPATAHTNDDRQACIDACLDCHVVCTSTLQHCLEMGGRHTEPAHVRLMLDCAEICQTSANFMLRGSPLHRHTCGACAEVCARCADDCAKFGGDPMMQDCAAACRTCAEACRRMAEMTD